MILQLLSSTNPELTEKTENLADSTKVALQNIAEQLAEDPSGFLTDMLSHFIDFGLKVLGALILYAIGALIIKWIKRLLTSFFKRRNTEKTVATFVGSLVSIVLTIILVVMTINALGINTVSITALLAAGGVAIGMALNGTVQNLAGGLMIMIFRPFKVGDLVRTEGYEGYVTEVNIVNTKIRQYDNTVIILANGSLFNGNISNVSFNEHHRVDWKVNVAYGSDSDTVKKILLEIMRSDPRILSKATTPDVADPSVNFNAFNDSSIEFAAKAWVNFEDYWQVLYDVNERIYKELPANGVEFPYPQMDIHIKQN